MKKFIVATVLFIYSLSTPLSLLSGEAMKLEIRNNIFYVEVAKTDEERERGLMFREKLNQNEGMLFVYDKPQYLSFWMKNTFIPLSVAFISDSGVIVDILSMTPLSEKLITSSVPCKYALEVIEGGFKSKGIMQGDKVIFNNN